MVITIIFLFCTCLIIFILVDWYVSIKIWSRRIHIGRWTDRQIWADSLLKITRKWIKHAPTVKLTDNNHYILWDMLRKKYRVATIQSWQDAGLILGLCAANQKEPIIQYIQTKLTPNGKWLKSPIHIDAALLAYALLEFSGEDKQTLQKIRPAMDEIYKLILSHQEGETIAYRKHVFKVRYVDTLGLICPFLISYGHLYDNEESIRLAIRQIKEYDAALLPNIGFPCHAFDMEHSLPRGIYDWGRGIGWYILALVECKRSLLGVKNFKYDFDFDQRIIHLSSKLLDFQNVHGGFGAMVFDKQAYPESSITVLAGLLFHEAYLLTRQSSYKQAIEKVEKSLMKVTQRNGCIDYCQGDTKGIGFYSHTFSYMPFVQGLALVLVNRINKEQ